MSQGGGAPRPAPATSMLTDIPPVLPAVGPDSISARRASSAAA